MSRSSVYLNSQCLLLKRAYEVLRYGKLLQEVLSKLADIATPLTNLSKKATFDCSEHCQKAFGQVKTVLTHTPVLMAPSLTNPLSW